MSKNLKKSAHIEKIIKKELRSLNDGVEMVMFGTHIEGDPPAVVYYDRENKGCLMIDEYNLSGVHWENDDILYKFISNHPDRFVRIPYEIKNHDYDLMEDFAYMKKNSKLIQALQGRRPMATFNYLVSELDLYNEWDNFRYHAYDKQLKEWAQEYDIAL